MIATSWWRLETLSAAAAWVLVVVEALSLIHAARVWYLP